MFITTYKLVLMDGQPLDNYILSLPLLLHRLDAKY